MFFTMQANGPPLPGQVVPGGSWSPASYEGLPYATKSSSLSLIEGQPLLSFNGKSPLQQLEVTIDKMLTERGDYDEQEILGFYDSLYKRFVLKYGNTPEVQIVFQERQIGEKEQQLLQGIKVGDVQLIRSFMGNEFGWDFVYPPAQVNTGADGSTLRSNEGWCRSPLGLLVFPDDSVLERMLPNVDNERRLALIREALRKGADPNYPPVYWANPAVLACQSGDLEALTLLADNGCNLSQKFEFGTQSRPEFSLVHAATVNGHKHVLEYLFKHVPEVFTSVDAEGNNALHTLMKHSRDLEAAVFLLDCGCDGFAFNQKKESPFSLAVEFLPDLAKELLGRQSKVEGKWMGRDVYTFCFNGVVLPLDESGQPLQVRHSSGELMGVEDMIIKQGAAELLLAPLMQDLLNLKWRCFGKTEYLKRLAPYAAFVVAMLVCTTAEPHSRLFKISTMIAVPLLLYEIFNIVTHAGNHIGFWGLLDRCNIFIAVLAIVYKGLHSADLPLPYDKRYLRPIFAVFSMLLQMTMTLRGLRLVVVDKYVGPLIIAVTRMLYDTVPWLVLVAVTVVGHANAYYALVHSDPEEDIAEESDFDWRYTRMIKTLVLAATSVDSSTFLQMPHELEERNLALQICGWLLFWTFTAIAVLMLFNMLIALYNTTYVNVVEGNSESTWAFLRLQLMVYLEAERGNSGVQAYYRKVQRFDGSRSFASSAQ